MAQFNDFDALFGRTPMHCGLVNVSSTDIGFIWGKSMDLVERDAPPKDGTEMGVNALRVMKKPVSNFGPVQHVHIKTRWHACQVCGTPRTRPEDSNNNKDSSKDRKGNHLPIRSSLKMSDMIEF